MQKIAKKSTKNSKNVLVRVELQINRPKKFDQKKLEKNIFRRSGAAELHLSGTYLEHQNEHVIF